MSALPPIADIHQRDLIREDRSRRGLQAGDQGRQAPKTRSGKVLRGTMKKIAHGEPWTMPATIDDPAILREIENVLKGKAVGM